MKAAIIQLDTVWESKRENHQKAGIFVEKAASKGCDVAVLPEMFDTGFSMNVGVVAEGENGESRAFLSGISKKCGIYVIAGFAVKGSEGKARNMALVFNKKGEIIAEFAKLHPFSHMGEDNFYEQGETPVSFDIEGMPSSVFICYDLRFPEVFRMTARGVKAIFVIANWPASRAAHWEALLKARAIENQCYIIGVNRTGKDANGIDYHGSSRLYGPSGEEVCSGGPDEEMIMCEIDPHAVDAARKGFDALKDMRFVQPRLD